MQRSVARPALVVSEGEDRVLDAAPRVHGEVFRFFYKQDITLED
jgi:hypothetical protein